MGTPMHPIVFINLLFDALYVLIFVHVVLSWVMPDARRGWQRGLAAVVEPILLPFRKLIPPVGGVDLSPLLAGVVLMLLQRLLVR